MSGIGRPLRPRSTELTTKSAVKKGFKVYCCGAKISQLGEVMKILHILKTAPDASTRKIIEVQSTRNEVMVIDLTKGGVSYDKLVADVFSHERVFCW
jgi:hypothetical protein